MNITAADNELVRRDKQLLGMSTILNPLELGQKLARNAAVEPGKLARQYIRYKPNTNCLVTYTSDGGEPLFYAKAYADNFEMKLAKHAERVQFGTAIQGRFWALSEDRVMVRQFPLDERLRSLGMLADPASRDHLLRRVIRNHSDLSDATLEPLAYKPERRFVAKLSGVGPEDFVLKFFRADPFSRSLANLRWLKMVGCRLLPRLRAKSKRHCILLLNWSPGQTLREHMVHGPVQSDFAESIGAALMQLHRQPGSLLLARWSPDNEIRRLHELSNTLAILVPTVAEQAKRLCSEISRMLASLPVDRQVIHGDFHSKQILLHEGTVRFLDADELATGPGQLDVGTFIAHLHRDALSGRIPSNAIPDVIDVFTDGYAKAGGRTDAINLFTALALVKFSHHPFRASEDCWDERIQRIILLAESFVVMAQKTTNTVRCNESSCY